MTSQESHVCNKIKMYECMELKCIQSCDIKLRAICMSAYIPGYMQSHFKLHLFS